MNCCLHFAVMSLCHTAVIALLHAFLLHDLHQFAQAHQMQKTSMNGLGFVATTRLKETDGSKTVNFFVSTYIYIQFAPKLKN